MDEKDWFSDTFSLFDAIFWYTLLNDSVKSDISFRSSVNNDLTVCILTKNLWGL